MNCGRPGLKRCPLKPNSDQDCDVPQVVGGSPVPVTWSATFWELMSVKDQSDEVSENTRNGGSYMGIGNAQQINMTECRKRES